jgi:hypothetical protein
MSQRDTEIPVPPLVHAPTPEVLEKRIHLHCCQLEASNEGRLCNTRAEIIISFVKIVSKEN